MMLQIPDATAFVDGDNQAMKNLLRALAYVGDDDALMFEDDAILTSDFMAKITPIVYRYGKRCIVQFFSRRGKDLTVGSRYEPGKNFNYGCCYYLPKGFAKRIIAYYDSWPMKERHPTGLDLLVADWMDSVGLSYYLHVPSLVQHAVGESSIDKRRPKARQSKTFIP
jgi:GR25 family glycosyltransferase involved in LPS biosynthesis